MRLLAPAKVNFRLRVVGRRADGYHFLESLMVPVSLYDSITVRVRPGEGICLQSDDPTLPTERANLAWRAASLLLSEARVSARVEIGLEKRIPAGSGLGGGSSDAAAVLHALNSNLRLQWPPRRLAALGLKLGADVPFFVYGRPAWVRGIGERVRPLESFARRWLVLAWPGFPLSTKWVYDRLRRSLTRGSDLPKIPRFTGGHGLRDVLHNDLETVAEAAYPGLRSVKEKILALGAEGCLMSGSGSACFGLFASRATALRAAATMKEMGFWAEAAHTIQRGPLYRAK